MAETSNKKISVLLQPSVQFSLYLLPIILFFILYDFKAHDDIFSNFTWVNYVAGYVLYLLIIELARSMHSNEEDSKRARNAFNQLVVYFPLCLFLLTASYALYMAGSEVFNVEPLAKQQLLQAETHKYLEQYKTDCENAKQSSQEQLNCVQKYLDGSIFAQLDDLKAKYENTSNSYSIIAIMTGFFGVLMTVLVIYFSLSGREVLQDKLERSDELYKESQERVDGLKKSFEDHVKKAIDAFDQKIGDSSKDSETKITELQNKLLYEIKESKESSEGELKKLQEELLNEIKISKESSEGELKKLQEELLNEIKISKDSSEGELKKLQEALQNVVTKKLKEIEDKSRNQQETITKLEDKTKNQQETITTITNAFPEKFILGTDTVLQEALPHQQGTSNPVSDQESDGKETALVIVGKE